MAIVSNSVAINAPPDQVWALLGDPSRMDEYHPMLTAAEWTSEKTEVPGARVRWYFAVKNRAGYYDEEVVEYVFGREIILENRGGKNIPPFALARTSFSLEEQGGRTVVEMAIEYRLKGPMRIFEGLAKGQYRKILLEILDGAKNKIEAG